MKQLSKTIKSGLTGLDGIVRGDNATITQRYAAAEHRRVTDALNLIAQRKRLGQQRAALVAMPPRHAIPGDTSFSGPLVRT